MPHVQLWGLKMKTTLINTDLDQEPKDQPKERLLAEQCGGENKDWALVCGSRHCLQSWLQRVAFFLPQGLSDALIQDMRFVPHCWLLGTDSSALIPCSHHCQIWT